MITIDVYKQGNYPVSVKVVKARVRQVLEENGIVSDTEASVAIVGENRIAELAVLHLNEPLEIAREHPVLSFPTGEIEGHFVFPPDSTIHLGEIVVSYPKAVDSAKKSGKLVDEVVSELAEHGALHLIGIHHD